MSGNNLAHKIDVLLGFAHKARQLVTGSTAVEVSLRRGRLRLLIVATDTSRWTAQKLLRLAARARVPAFVYGSKSEFARLLGKGPVGVLGVETTTFSRPLIEFLQGAPEARLPDLPQTRKRASAVTSSPHLPKKRRTRTDTQRQDYVPRNPHRRPGTYGAPKTNRH